MTYVFRWATLKSLKSTFALVISLIMPMAFILGVLPMARATGPGAEIRQVLGTAVLSGMLGVTLFGLFLTPAFYVVLRGIFEQHE